MSVGQVEAIAHTINNLPGAKFVTQPAKSVKSIFADSLKGFQTLIESNDPYLSVDSFLEQQDPESTDIVTVVTKGSTIIQNLPFLSSKNFKSKAVVSHVELSNFDYAIITSLRDLNYPVVVSQSAKEASVHSKLAYNLAAKLQKSTFHFFAPSTYKTSEVSNVKSDDVLIKDLEKLEVADILSYFDVKPFHTVNNVSKPKDSTLYLGQLNDELVSAFTKENVLLITPNVYQPFYLSSLLSGIPSSVESITLLLQSTTSTSTTFSPLVLDFFKEYPKYQTLKNFSKIVGSNFGFIQTDKYASTVANLLKNVRSASPIQNLSFGKINTEISTKSSKKSIEDHTKAQSNAWNLEQAYLKVLQQINQTNLKLLNEYDTTHVGSETNPEFGFGSFLFDEEQHKKLTEDVFSAIQSNSFHSIDNGNLIEYLSKWLVQVREGQAVEDKLVDEIVALLKTDEVSTTAKELLSRVDYFKVHSNWLIGSDAWSYDLGSSGIHSVITSGKNINMLVIDSEPYKEKSEQDASTPRKKDIGLYAMNYGNCYVASIAIYSSYTQVLQAFIEAEKFNGPSIVLAYLPYSSESDSTLPILQETKKAVDSGYWPLYRYNPTLEIEQDAFKLDSSNLRKQLKDFLDRENRLSLLTAKDPVLSRNLTQTANTEIKSQQKKVADESFAQLLQGLSGPPLTVAFASDGGNAEALAKKIHRQATGRGLKSVVLQMDDISIEDLPTEVNIVFVASTTGQGELPINGRQFWDGLKSTTDLDLSTIKYSVFGLGDSEYWPRKEDKHYYNKPGKDLFTKLAFYGGVELCDLGLGDDQDADGYSTGFNEWIEKLWVALGVDNVEGVEEPKPITNEDMKIGSDYLRGTIAEGLKDESTGAISAVDQQLTKFHGIYMQDDRDIREERKAEGREPAYSFMVRLRLPGGKTTPAQYLKLDELADFRGNGTLKITTRATFQLHGVVKHDLKPAIRGMNSALLDTLAACGDVNRNVMVSALPHNAKVHAQIAATGSLISEYLLPQTTGYHEIWLQGDDDGDKPGDSANWEGRKDGPKKTKTLVAGNALADVEPMYGKTYLPRKFKIVITVPPFNDVDVYAHDIGLIAIVEDNVVIGYNVLVGGGMGTTHNNKKTYPRTGSMFGFVETDKIHIACEKIMLVQRDHGDRTNRKHARCKYTIDDLGVDVFKAKVEEQLDFTFAEPREFKIESNVDYFGWCKDELGFNHFTAFIENGRIEDTAQLPQKSGLKKIAEYLNGGRSGEYRLTGNQHLVISNIEDKDLAHVKSLMAEYKLDNTEFSALRLSSASCVAFPTCGLAMAEAERYLPELLTKLEESLEDFGLRHDSVVMRMTGCPNGCARPWLAEVALVGKAAGAYNLMLGGGHHGERLNKIYRYSIKEDEILEILKDLFKRWSQEREDGEPFGDYCIRAGIIKPTTEGKYFHDDIPEEA